MTSQGTAHGRFTRAVQRRNLWAAEMSLRELDQPSLEDALAYLDLLAEQKPEKLERACVRWHGQLRNRGDVPVARGVAVRAGRIGESLRRCTRSRRRPPPLASTRATNRDSACRWINERTFCPLRATQLPKISLTSSEAPRATIHAMGRIVWSVREGRTGELDAQEILNGYRSAHPLHEPRLGDLLRLPDGSRYLARHRLGGGRPG